METSSTPNQTIPVAPYIPATPPAIKSSNMKFIITIIALIIAVLGLGGYIVVDKFVLRDGAETAEMAGNQQDGQLDDMPSPSDVNIDKLLEAYCSQILRATVEGYTTFEDCMAKAKQDEADYLNYHLEYTKNGNYRYARLELGTVKEDGMFSAGTPIYLGVFFSLKNEGNWEYAYYDGPESMEHPFCNEFDTKEKREAFADLPCYANGNDYPILLKDF